MMGVPSEHVTPEGASKRIAEMLRTDCDVEIKSGVVRLFIKANWSELSRLAHTIHGTKRLHAADLDAPVREVTTRQRGAYPRV